MDTLMICYVTILISSWDIPACEIRAKSKRLSRIAPM